MTPPATATDADTAHTLENGPVAHDGDPKAPAPDVPPTVGAELAAITRLALPVLVSQVGLLTMGLVDTLFVGRLGAAELGAVALGDAIFFTIHVIVMGLLQALEPLVAQAWGANEAEKCGAAWRAGLRIALAAAIPVALLTGLAGVGLQQVGKDPVVAALTAEFLWARVLGTLPMLLFVTDRSLLTGLGATAAPMVMAVLANGLNAFLAWGLIFGDFGLPALGVAGSGLATAACNWFMWLGVTAWVRLAPAHRAAHAVSKGSPRVPPGLVRLVVVLGLPLGLAHGLEVGAFAAGSFVVERFGVAAIAAHQVAIKLASTTFMMAVAVGAATGARVGQATGARRPNAAARSGWVGIGLGAAAMAAAGVVYLVRGEAVFRLFTQDEAVIAVGVKLLFVAAAFQVSDGVQAVASGALRGLGDTRWPALANLVAHWFVALPLGAFLGFELGLGAVGMWWALAVGLTGVALILTLRFRALRDVPPIAQP
jgi:MATE family multidrug resistance protein